MNDIHQKYADESKRVYLGKADSLVSFPGVGKVKLVWYASADPKLETTVIYWNDRQDSVLHPFERTQDGVQKDSVIITSLEEGEYIFELVNRNSRGEFSVPVTVMGKSYSAAWSDGLKARPVASVSPLEFDPATQSYSAKIVWGDVPARGCRSKITYKKGSTGEDAVVYVDETETETTVTDVGNRLGLDVLNMSSIYAPENILDPFETPVQKEQFVFFTASGTRVENTAYNGGQSIFTFTYAGQEKMLRLTEVTENGNVYACSRVAELNPAVPASFKMTLSGNQVTDFEGYYATADRAISTGNTASSFDPATYSLTLCYKVTTPSGEYAVTETLVPKNTSIEIESEKPFDDARDKVVGDLRDYPERPFARLSDGNVSPVGDANCWLTIDEEASINPSITIDLKKTLKLTRMIVYPLMDNNVDANSVFSNNFNPHEFDVWGSATLREGQDAAYWADTPGAGFKSDGWVNLGQYTVERLDLRGWSNELQFARGLEGHHVCLPDATPVRYIRYYNRGKDRPNVLYLRELTFFGYEQ
jgi:hypothetical protein